jgi:phosphate/sulfate permease
MNPSNTQVLIRLIVSAAVVGGAIGAGIAVAMSVLTKQSRLDRAVLIDAVLGVIGFAGTRMVFALAPIPAETITRHVGNAIITTTMKRYQYPNRVAFPLAVLLPLAYELFLFRQRQPR